MKLDPRIWKELKRRAKGDERALKMWRAYLAFLKSRPALKNISETANHHILWRSNYPQYVRSPWNVIRLTHTDHTAAAALSLAAEPRNAKLRAGFYATYRLAGTARTWTPEKISELIKLYKSGWGSVELGKKWNRSSCAIISFLRRRGVHIRTSAENNLWKPKAPKTVIKDYLKGLTLAEVGRKHGASNTAVWRFLHLNKIKLRDCHKSRLWAPPNPKQIVKDYKSGMSVEYLGEKYKQSPHRVRRFLLRNGVKSIRGAHTYHIWNENPRNIIRLYKSGFSMKEIGKKFGVSHIPVRRILLDFGISLRGNGEAQRIKNRRLSREIIL